MFCCDRLHGDVLCRVNCECMQLRYDRNPSKQLVWSLSEVLLLERSISLWNREQRAAAKGLNLLKLQLSSVT